MDRAPASARARRTVRQMKSASPSSSAARWNRIGRPAGPLGPEAFLLAILVLPDHGGRGVEDDLRRPVVPLEADGAGFGEVLFEVEDVAQVGAAPLVDRLVRIPDDGEVAVFGRELADQEVLRAVGVLVFVDQDVAELRRVAGAHVLGAFEELHALEQEVVEVERVALAQHVEVALEHLAQDFLAVVPAAAKGLRALHAVARVADPGERHAGLDELLVHVELAQDLLDGRELIGRIEDDEVAGQADRGGLAAEEARADRVERRDPEGTDVDVHQARDALAASPRRPCW